MGIEDQLNAFRAGLSSQKADRVIPGFLFRDGKDTTFFNLSNGEIDEELLGYQTEVYRQAIEARNQILEEIRPHEILDMVKDIWRAWESEIEQTWEGANGAHLDYHYPRVLKEIRSSSSTRHNSAYPPDSWTETSRFETGKWKAQWLRARQEIGVSFGNAQFPEHISSTNSHLPWEFFADRSMGIPRTIWRRPDNLGIYTINHTSDNLSDVITNLWFGRYTSQQEIKDSLWQKLKAQEAQGQLPYQIYELENAKIEELRNRGLFIE